LLEILLSRCVILMQLIDVLFFKCTFVVEKQTLHAQSFFFSENSDTIAYNVFGNSLGGYLIFQTFRQIK